MTVDDGFSAGLAAARVRLRPIEPADYVELARFELSDELLARWRHRGSTPSPESYAQSLWNGVLTQFLVESAGGDVLGLVSCHDPDMVNRHASLSAVNFAGDATSGFIEGAALFVSFVFRSWDFVKLYLDVPAYNLHQVASRLSDVFASEGILKDHVFKFGRRWDLHVLAIHRAQWENFSASLPGPSGSHG